MRHFPLFLDLRGQRVAVSGAGETALAKLRLLLKTEARIVVHAPAPHPQLAAWASEGRIALFERQLCEADAEGLRLLYAANDDAAEDARVAAIGHAAGVLVNVVDHLEASDFITPAIVDRDPVTVAIGTEGTAPVLARRIKADVEAALPPETGPLAAIARTRRDAAERLPAGRVRRAVWTRYFGEDGPRAWREGGEAAARVALDALLSDTVPETRGHVSIVGAGPGDPELLTLKARRILHDADVVIHDRLVAPGILELARREAILIETGKTPGGESWTQEAIDALIVEHAASGAHVARLKSGDPAIYGRLDEEMDALDAAGIPFEIVPGITSAIAAASEIKVSLTRRHRNSSVRFLTGQDVAGFAEQDWRGLAKPGEVAAIYMGVRAARFLQGRLLIYGADGQKPVTVIENVSRPDRKVIAATLASLPASMVEGGVNGPAILFLGLTPRAAERAAMPELSMAEAL